MKKIVVIMLSVLIVTTAGCYNSMKRTFNREYALQEDTRVVNTAFPMFQDFYNWFVTDYNKSVIAANNEASEDKQLGFTIKAPEYLDGNIVVVRSDVNISTYRDGFPAKPRRKAIEWNIHIRTQKLLELCKQHSFKVIKYKYGLSRELVDFWGASKLSPYREFLQTSYSSAYVAYDSEDEAVFMFTVVTFGGASLSGELIDRYSMDLFIFPQYETNIFLDSLTNTFIRDMENRTYAAEEVQ